MDLYLLPSATVKPSDRGTAIAAWFEALKRLQRVWLPILILSVRSVLKRLGIGAMAVHAILQGGFVEQHGFALNLLFEPVAHGTAHVCVRACQGKLSAFIVVKRGRLPPLIHMAISAFHHSILGRKLAAVRIRVARFTIFRRAFELNLVGVRQRFVALPTCDSTMSSG